MDLEIQIERMRLAIYRKQDLYIGEEAKCLWCSSTVWLLSTQTWMSAKAYIYSGLSCIIICSALTIGGVQ